MRQRDTFGAADSVPVSSRAGGLCAVRRTSSSAHDICALRRIGLAYTPFERATCGTIRLKLLKLGALITISARRVRIAFASACQSAQEWRLAAARLANARGSPA